MKIGLKNKNLSNTKMGNKKKQRTEDETVGFSHASSLLLLFSAA